MKHLLLLILISLSIPAIAQKRSSYDDGIYQSSRAVAPNSQKQLNLSAGDYLKKAANQRLTSTLTGVCSGFMMGISPSIEGKQSQNIVFIGGAVFGIVSIVTHFMGISSEYNAGIQLNKERKSTDQVYVQPAKDGVGVNISF